MEILERDTAQLERVKGPFPRISYDEAVSILQEKGSDIKWGTDLGGDDETILSQQYDRPVLVHRYPKAVKAFYMKECEEDSESSHQQVHQKFAPKFAPTVIENFDVTVDDERYS